MKRTSEDKETSKNQTNKILLFMYYTMLSCLYDKWWVGIITNVDREDVQVNFMHLSSPSRSFQWPHVICWAPNDHILCKIDIFITSSGRFDNILEHGRN